MNRASAASRIKGGLSSSLYTYECTYTNPNPFTMNFGKSEDSNEQYIGVGIYYTAARPVVFPD